MVCMARKSQRWMYFGVLLAFLLASFCEVDVFAETSASDAKDVNITVHVLSNEAEEPETPEEPIPDPDPVEYDEPEVIDDTPTPVDVELDTDEGEIISDDEMEEEENNGGTVDDLDPEDEDKPNPKEDEEEEEEDDLPVPNTSADIEETSGPSAPDTGDETNMNVFGTVNGFFIIMIVGCLLAVGVIVWRVKRGKVVRRFDFGTSYSKKSSNVWNRFAFKESSMGFDADRNKWMRLFTWRRLATIVVLGSVVIATGMFISKDRQPEGAVAAGFTYPYTVSTSGAGGYDIYVKQGEFKKASFAIRTSTDNLTGYTLNMATEAENLTNSSNNVHIAMVNDGTIEAGFSNNTWGFSTNGSSYGKLPRDRGNGKMVRQTKGASASGNSVVVYFAAKVASDTPVGDYTTTLHLDAVTNPVYKVLDVANGNVARITRVSDNSVLSTDAKVLLGEELRVSNSTDDSGILQTVTVNGAAVGNNDTVTVSGDMEIGTQDDSMHFLRNDFETNSTSAIGDAILIRSKGKYWLVDTGRKNASTGAPKGSTIAAYLNKFGIKSLDYVLLTHAHSDHMGGVDYLISQGFINSQTTVYLRGCEATSSIGDDGKTASTSVKDYCDGRVSNLKTRANANVIDFYNHEAERAAIQANGIDFGNYKITMFNIDDADGDGHIDRNSYRENLNSIGMKLVHKPSGKTVFLSADWEWGIEDKYGSTIGKVDLLKPGHHGIKTSSSYEFIKALDPKTMVITSRNVANKYGNPNRQAAAWAFVEQNGGNVYFTGDVSGDAVSVGFNSLGYSIKKGTEHSIVADANTLKSNDSAQTSKPYHWSWNGGLVGWYYPTNKNGSGGVVDEVGEGKGAYNDYTTKYYVYVYKKKSDAGNIIAHVDKCIDNYTYKFKSTYGNGVAKGRTSGCK